MKNTQALILVAISLFVLQPLGFQCHAHRDLQPGLHLAAGTLPQPTPSSLVVVIVDIAADSRTSRSVWGIEASVVNIISPQILEHHLLRQQLPVKGHS